MRWTHAARRISNCEAIYRVCASKHIELPQGNISTKSPVSRTWLSLLVAKRLPYLALPLGELSPQVTERVCRGGSPCPPDSSISTPNHIPRHLCRGRRPGRPRNPTSPLAHAARRISNCCPRSRCDFYCCGARSSRRAVACPRLPSTAATRSGRFICHRQRSHRSHALLRLCHSERAKRVELRSSDEHSESESRRKSSTALRMTAGSNISSLLRQTYRVATRQHIDKIPVSLGSPYERASRRVGSLRPTAQSPCRRRRSIS